MLAREKEKKARRSWDRQQASKKGQKRTTAPQVDSDDQMDIDSGDESDGNNALREVEAREELKAKWQGPGNTSMQHFHELTATVDKSGQKRWEFRCRFCSWYVKFRSSMK
jgi:hypothetical protein